MEAVYRWKGDKRILLYEEGNQILAQVIGTGRTVQWGSLCRDYHSCGVSLFWEDEIYVAYVNTENVLMWDKLFAEGRLVLVKGDDWGSISTVRIAPVAGERTQLYVWYRMADPGNGTDSLYVINPLGERKVQRLVYGTERIERYEILQHGEVSYLLYKLATEAKLCKVCNLYNSFCQYLRITRLHHIIIGTQIKCHIDDPARSHGRQKNNLQLRQ